MKLMPSQLVCQQAVELMSDYLEGSLSRRDRRRLEKHLAAVTRAPPTSNKCERRSRRAASSRPRTSRPKCWRR